LIRVLIVDDERPARVALRLLLEQVEGFELVGEAGSGRTAVAAALKFDPDLMLLDIRMPDMNGFEVLRAIPAARRPRVIFVTAYDRHALRAFEVHALDYLLKPITAARFEAALERARTAHSQRLAVKTLEELAAAVGGSVDPGSGRVRAGGIDHLTVRDGARYRVVATQTIHWIEACGNYVVLHTADGQLLHRMTLTQLERVLPANRFARIHRGTIVNVSEIAEIDPGSHGDAEVKLRNGETLSLSRTYRASIL
jgi:two-component system, LytTR family, response regulator